MERAKNSLWRAALVWVITLSTGVTSWQLTMVFLKLGVPLRGLSFALALALIHTVFTWGLAETFLSIGFQSKWIYRGTFLISVAWGTWLWFRHPYAVLLLLVIVLASFLGALMATRQRLGIWEDNFPPPKEIRVAVYKKHQEIIGRPPKVPWAKRVFDISLSFFGLFFTPVFYSVIMKFADGGKTSTNTTETDTKTSS